MGRGRTFAKNVAIFIGKLKIHGEQKFFLKKFFVYRGKKDEFQMKNFVYAQIENTRYTPFLLAKKIQARAILESASFQKGRERFSILMVDEAFQIIEKNKKIFFKIEDKEEEFKCDFKSRDALLREKSPDILDALSYITQQNNISEEIQKLHIPLPGAGIGFLSYEFIQNCDKVILNEQTDSLNLPDALFVVGHFYIVLDHFTENIHLFGLNYKEHSIDLDFALKKLLKRLKDMDFSYIEEENENPSFEVLTDLENSKNEYIEKVNTLKKHIECGNIIQAVPSRRMQIKSNAAPLLIYGKLRKVNPSPYLFFVDFGDFALIGASPESLIRVRGQKASIHPIAGTIPRGDSEIKDALLCAQLKSDKKERAEHLMLVDLARNDLGRVCKAGSVHLTQYAECEFFSHLIHLVSIVEGDLKDDISAPEALRAAFPAGTVSGAPKISAIQILSTLEKEKRRFYAGAVGYMATNGNLDFCITIRAALFKNGIYTLQAGGGIVWDSQPEKEWNETVAKLGAMADVLTGRDI